jgi:hypothetical protein
MAFQHCRQTLDLGLPFDFEKVPSLETKAELCKEVVKEAVMNADGSKGQVDAEASLEQCNVAVEGASRQRKVPEEFVFTVSLVMEEGVDVEAFHTQLAAEIASGPPLQLEVAGLNLTMPTNFTITLGEPVDLQVLIAEAIATQNKKWTTPVIVIAVILALVIAILVPRALRAPPAFDFAAEFEKMVARGDVSPEAFGSGDDSGGGGPQMPKELKRSTVYQTTKLGAGQFGEVYKGNLAMPKVPGGIMVAIKTATDATSDGAKELTEEACLMAIIGEHDNLVSLHGVVTRGEPLLMVLSFCEHGDLQGLMRWPRGSVKKSPLAAKTFFEIALDIARGMDHLVQRHIVHRDLAARNVLIDSLLNCKVADFGMHGVRLQSDVSIQ